MLMRVGFLGVADEFSMVFLPSGSTRFSPRSNFLFIMLLLRLQTPPKIGNLNPISEEKLP